MQPRPVTLRDTSVYDLQEDWRGEIHQLSWKPRAFLLKGFLTEDECDHIIALAKPHMEKSEVADEETGQGVESDVRTSTGTFLETAQDETIAAIEKRVAQVRFTNGSQAATMGGARPCFSSLLSALPAFSWCSARYMVAPLEHSVTAHAAVPTHWLTRPASTTWQLRCSRSRPDGFTLSLQATGPAAPPQLSSSCPAGHAWLCHPAMLPQQQSCTALSLALPRPRPQAPARLWVRHRRTCALVPQQADTARLR